MNSINDVIKRQGNCVSVISKLQMSGAKTKIPKASLIFALAIFVL